MRKLLQRLWDIAADFANFMGGLGMRLVWLPKLHFSSGAEHVRTDPGPALFVLNHSWWMDAPMLCLLCRRLCLLGLFLGLLLGRNGLAGGGLFGLQLVCIGVCLKGALLWLSRWFS